MKAPSISEEPNVILYEWLIAKSCGHYFLVGFNKQLTTVRRSTAIASINVDDLTCCTMSGRHYQLSPLHAKGDYVKLLLDYFQATQGVPAVDGTAELLNDPSLIYTSFLLFDPISGKLRPAASQLQSMAENPAQWLEQFIDFLTLSDVDPSLLKTPLSLSDNEWKAYRAGKLQLVSVKVAFRARLLQDIFFMASKIADSEKTLDAASPESSSNAGNRIPMGIFSAKEMHQLFEEHRMWTCFADVIFLRQALDERLREPTSLG